MDEQGKTAPIELPGQQPSAAPASPVQSPPAESEGPAPPIVIQPDALPHEAESADATPALVARQATPAQQQVMFVPLAVSIGDGFKFGCGFFLAMVVASLAGFVVLGVLFVLTGLLGLSLPLGR